MENGLMKKHIIIISVICISAIALIHLSMRGPEEAHRIDEPLFLDVRTQEEYDSGHIIGAVLLPHDKIGQKAGTLLPDKNQKIFVYCQAGARSERAAKQLIEMGYTNIVDIGGIINWPGQIINSAGDIFYN